MYTYNAKVINVVDGDTLDVIIDLGFSLKQTQRLRLKGIDTPERGEQGYAEAKEMLTSLASGRECVITTSKADSFGRYVAELHLFNEEDGSHVFVNQLLLDLGLAIPYTGRT